MAAGITGSRSADSGSTKNLEVIEIIEIASRNPANTSALVCPNQIAEETHVETPGANELPSPGDRKKIEHSEFRGTT